jgi:RNA polymerase-binding transcription factor
MQPSEFSEFRERLERKARELVGALRDRDSIAVEWSPDDVDQMGMAIERERGALALEASTRVLRQVREALQRLQAGAYGLCLDCEEEISLKRLRAIPWAERCVRCQEKEDNHQVCFSQAA